MKIFWKKTKREENFQNSGKEKLNEVVAIVLTSEKPSPLRSVCISHRSSDLINHYHCLPLLSWITAVSLTLDQATTVIFSNCCHCCDVSVVSMITTEKHVANPQPQLVLLLSFLTSSTPLWPSIVANAFPLTPSNQRISKVPSLLTLIVHIKTWHFNARLWLSRVQGLWIKDPTQTI